MPQGGVTLPQGGVAHSYEDNETQLEGRVWGFTLTGAFTYRANDFPFQKKDFAVSPCSEFRFVSASSVFMHQRLCYFRNFIINVRTFNRKHQ